MEKIPDEIISFYQQLEQITSFNRWDLISQVKPLSEIHLGFWKDALITEQICLRFALDKGKLKSSTNFVTKDGNEGGFPTVDNFSKESIAYLKERANSTKNPILLSRYNHLLFDIEKNRNYAIKAIEAYKQLIYLKIDIGTIERLLPSLQAVLKLTEKIKYKSKEVKEEVIALILNENIAISYRYYIANEFINCSLVKSQELKFLPELAVLWLSQLNEADYYIKKRILESALKVAIKNKIDTSCLYEKLAENEDFILQQHIDDSDFVKLKILSEIMEYYKKAKKTAKYEEFKKEYTRVRPLTKLSLIELPNDEYINLIINEQINKNLKNILAWDSFKIFFYFSNHTNLFPDLEKITSKTIGTFKKSFPRITSSDVIDINGNIKSLSEEEELENEKYKTYQLNLGIPVLPFFIRSMQTGIFNFKISYNHLFKYLHENSWYGQRLPEMKLRSIRDNETYTWLELMAPALQNLFTQLEASFLLGPENPFTNYVLAIDSLTLKFEGALRDFVRLVGGSSSKFKHDEIKEMLLEDLLNSAVVKEKFTDNDLALFKMVFTNKGDNIRNNVAHCFYHASDYRLEMICKIFLCILRLGKYQLTPVSENE